MYGTSPLQVLAARVATVASAGGEVPAEFTRIRQRWEAYRELTPDSLTDQLASAITGEGSLDDLGDLRALALAGRAGAQLDAELANDLEGPVFLALRDVYEPVADSNYRMLAKSFTSTASALSKAVAVVDPDSDPAAMVTASDKERKAWADSALLAVQLDEQVPALVAAAELAGLVAVTGDRQLPLLCEVSGIHRRRVWEAWESTDNRGGRWVALIRVGATVRALANLDDYQSYRRPAPIEQRTVAVDRGVSRLVEYDPEDAEHAVSA